MDAVVETLTDRLTALYDQCTEDERAVLDAFLEIVIHANLDESDVEGFILISGRSRLGSASKSLEAQDKLGNFEIQDLMSAYNQAEQLASSVQQKLNATNNGVIGKI